MSRPGSLSGGVGTSIMDNDTSGTKTPESDKDSTLNNSEDETSIWAKEFTKTDNGYPCLPQLFENTVIKHPFKPALICGNRVLTYTELDKLADHLANALIENGVQPGDIVGVALSRSAELVAFLLAVAKTGAAYVPIDPSFPAERIRQMMDDASPKLLVIDSDTSSITFLPSCTVLVVTMTSLLSSVKFPYHEYALLDPSAKPIFYSNSNTETHDVTSLFPATPTDSTSSNRLPIPIPSPDSLAYIIYTSGSTGTPKGVEITHSSLSNLLLSMLTTPGFTSQDTLLAVTTISFDMAVPELFLPLVAGGTVVVAKQDEVRDMAVLARLVQTWGVTVLQATPVLWGMVMDYLGSDDNNESRLKLKQIWTGGEALSRDLATKLLRHGEVVWNLYGPTETTVYAAMWRVRPGEEEKIKIGTAVDGLMLYVVDTEKEDMITQVQPGDVGELCVGGRGVARGYRNRAKLTRDKFVRNPWHGGVIYRTGDLAKVDPATGHVSVLGRMDGQVKIRGYRIEVGDIEAAMLQHERVSGAVVVSRDERLVAYFTTRKTDGQGETSSLTTGVMRPFLASRLPTYMVPAFFVELKGFPTTLNGKIDRKALPDPVSSLSGPAPWLSTTELESQILNIWSSVLGHNRINIGDNFFEIGGDSQRLVRVQKELERVLKHPVSAVKLFQHFTIKTLATYLTSDTTSTTLKPTPTARPTLSQAPRQDMAIVSMACRLPGGISTPEDFWTLLSSGGDAITGVPPGRWEEDADTVTGATPPPYPRRGGFLPSVHSFDASLFGISPREARALDPSHYLMLETVHEAFERAGYTGPGPEPPGTQIGVYMGVSNIPAFQTGASGNTDNEKEYYTITGSAPATLSGRISHHFGLSGPTMTIDTACSSSLVATHLACTALQTGECDVAIAGGVSLMLNPKLQAEFTRLGGTSPDGRCRSFSADTQGTGFSEGCVVILLKRVSDAVRDGDVIHAVIRASAVNHDGRSASLTTPNGGAQTKLVRTAIARAGLTPKDIDYVEAHGTGTRLGDPIEAAGLGEVFGGDTEREEMLWVGSVKSNIGHTQAAAGLAGLIKVVLAMESGVLPATLHVAKPTESVDWEGLRMMPLMKKKRWTTSKAKRRVAGVSAFGIGGTNAHVILEEGPSMMRIENDSAREKNQRIRKPFLLSADNDEALRGQAEKLLRHLTTRNGANLDLGDVAYSLATTRHHYRKRLAVLATDKSELLEKLSSVSSSPLSIPVAPGPPKLAMLFTGQGSQYLGMGKGLSDTYQPFAHAIQEIAAELDKYIQVPLLDVMWSTSPETLASSLLNRTDYAQPALFALEVSIWRLWQSWGIAPDYVLGHSLGELAAAHAAGILNLSDACRLVAARGRLMQAQSGDYSMLAIEAGRDDIEAAVEQLGCVDQVDIALYNTPKQTVISGTTTAVDKVSSYLARNSCKTKTIVVGHAFHSRYMGGMLAEFQAVAETVHFHPPTIRIISSLDGKLAEGGRMQNAEYWVNQVRKPVRFSQGIQALHEYGVNLFVEIGPHPVLCGMGAACLPDSEGCKVGWLPSISRGKNDVSTILGSFCDLHTRHADVDWRAYFAPFGWQRVQLPTYAFQRTFHQEVRAPGASGLANASPLERHAVGGVGHLEFDVSWVPPTDAQTEAPGEIWAIISASRSTWTTEVKTMLVESGIKLVELEDHARLTTTGTRAICLWDGDGDAVSQPQNVELVGKALGQLQLAARTQLGQSLVWVTHHAVGTGGAGDDEDMMPGPGSLLWGLMRTARSEHPELRLRLLDIGRHATRQAVLSALLLDSEPECAVRQDRVLVARMQRVSFQEVPPENGQFRSDGAVLITGGVGYLGAHVSRWLARKHNIRDLILTSRRGLNTGGAKELVAELSTVGINVTVVSSDVADPASVASLMALFTQERPLRGIVHAAGMSDSGVLSSLTAERCRKIIAPKAQGAWMLHEATKNMDLDFFVMFSSISGVMGMPGLANYAAANTFLDALAHARQGQGLPATSVAYGTWAGDGGMAARLGDGARSHLVQFGLDPLLPEDGLKLMDRAVMSGRPLTVAAKLDLERAREFYRHQGHLAPLLGSLVVNKTASASDSPHNLREKLREVKAAEHSSIVLGTVREVVAKALGFGRPFDVDIDRPLRDVGIDSLTAVQIRNRLSVLTGLSLSVKVALLHPNLRELSAALLAQLRDKESPLSPPSPLDNHLDIDAICNGGLDKSITFDNPSPHTEIKSVFLTGATGFIGAFVLHALLQQGVTVHCLVRASDAPTAFSRIFSTLQSYSLSLPPASGTLIVPVPGDISKPFLGLSPQNFSQLSSQIDAICHSAGLVDWMRPFSEYIGPNVVSMHEVLRLASGCPTHAHTGHHPHDLDTTNLPRVHPQKKKNIPIHLISTISTLSFHAGVPPTKESDPEHGYGTSKYLAERLVCSARWRGADATIYRLPYATASTATGAFRSDKGDFLHNLIGGGLLELNCFPTILGDADMGIVLPVDYLAETVVAVMLGGQEGCGRDWDFRNEKAVGCNDFLDMVGKVWADLGIGAGRRGNEKGAGGEAVEMAGFGEWKRRALEYAAMHPQSRIARIAAVIDGYTEDTAAAMFQGGRVGRNVFGGEVRTTPELGEDWARKYLDAILRRS